MSHVVNTVTVIHVYQLVGATNTKDSSQIKNLITIDTPSCRNSNNCVVIVVKEEQEPQSFKMIFPAWE